MAKKSKTEKIQFRIPIVVLAQLEGIAANAGVTVEQVINVWLATELLKRPVQDRKGEP